MFIEKVKIKLAFICEAVMDETDPENPVEETSAFEIVNSVMKKAVTFAENKDGKAIPRVIPSGDNLRLDLAIEIPVDSMDDGVSLKADLLNALPNFPSRVSNTLRFVYDAKEVDDPAPGE